MGIAIAPEVICDLCDRRLVCQYEWLPNKITGHTKTKGMTATARQQACAAGWKREPSKGRHQWKRIDVCPDCRKKG